MTRVGARWLATNPEELYARGMSRQRQPSHAVLGGADLEGPYRYLLWRRWEAGAASVLFVMLNPSTADHERDDPTLRRCVGFARRWGAGAVEIVNLFAWRATSPAALRVAHDPVGPRNDLVIAQAARRCEAIVVAWGAGGELLGRAAQIAELLRPLAPRCLGVTTSGAPRHPLYVRKDRAPERWPR